MAERGESVPTGSDQDQPQIHEDMTELPVVRPQTNSGQSEDTETPIQQRITSIRNIGPSEIHQEAVHCENLNVVNIVGQVNISHGTSNSADDIPGTTEMAEPEAVTEVEASRHEEGDQSYTVSDRSVLQDTVMTDTGEVTQYGATDGAHGPIRSIRTICPPEIDLPGFEEAMEQLSLSSIPEGARPENANVINVINEMTVSQGTSLGSVDDIPDLVKERMKSAKDIFVETKAYENIYDALENDGHVLVTGSPGSGKTTMALYLMGKYRRKKYCVKFVDNVAHFKVQHQVNLKVPTLLVLDDVFGRFALTSEVKVHCTKVFDYLETHFKRMEEKRKKIQAEDESKDDETSATPETPLKVIMSSRTNISRNQIVSTMLRKYKTSLFRQSTIADLTVSELKEHEKESILQKHLVKARFDLTEHEIKNIACLEYKTLGFPYICQLFQDSCLSKDQAVKFFMEPWTYLHNLIRDIFTSDYPNYRAAVLLLMVLNDGTLNLIHLQQARKGGGNVELRKKIETVEEILPGVDHPNSLNEAAKDENQTLLLSEGDRMTFSHPTIYDVVAYVVGDRYPVFILQNCSLKFIIERTKLSEDPKAQDPSGGDMHSFMIQLTQDAVVALVERLAREIIHGNIALPLSHKCFTLENIATCLFSKLLAHDNIEQYLHSRDNDHGMGFLFWASFCSTVPVSKLSFEHTKFSLPEVLEGYLGCCMSGNVSSLRILVENSKDRLSEVAAIDVGHILRKKQETRPSVRRLTTAYSPTKTEVPSEIETPRSHGDNKDKLIHIATAYGFTAIVELLLDLVGVDIDARGGNDMTAIMYACYLGHKELVEVLLQRQADPELLDEEGDNCLHLACRDGSIDIIKLLLGKTMDINKRGEHARTPLMYASYKGHGDLVGFLLESGANAVPDESAIVQKNNCLHLACVKGETEIVRILLDQGRMEIEVRGERERTPLMYACRHGWLEAAKELVARNAKVNALDEGNMNCLHLTAINGNILVAEWLLSLNVGFIVDCINADGRTPLMLAMKHGHTDMAQILMTRGANIATTDHEKGTCLHMAARSGIWELLEVCLQNRLDVNSLTESGWTPVMAACKGGHIDRVKELVKRGADLNLGGGSLYAACTGNCLELIKYLVSQDIDINKRGPKERTPVMAACFHGNIEVVEYLQSHSADMTYTDEYNQTCLHIVCKSGNLQLAEKLVRLVPIDDPDKNGLTPLMYAVRSDPPELIDLLITNGANINTKNSHGKTSLHSACWFRNVNACARLLELGMDVDVLDSQNITPLMSLAWNKEDCKEIANLLVERGADINVRDKEGNTMLHVSATSDGHPAFARYILENDVDVNTQGSCNHTPVMSACKSGNKVAFDLYLDKGAKLDHKTNYGAKCLHLACMVDTDDTHIVNELLDRRVDINATDENDKTPAMYAISKGSVTILRLLLARNASFTVSDKRGNQSTLLHYACSNKNINTEKIQLLLQNGLRVNEPNMYYNQTPLMLACRHGCLETVKELVAWNADLNKLDKDSMNCLHLTAINGNTLVAEWLLSLNVRFIVDCINADGRTPLMLAMKHGHTDMAGFLMTRGANIATTDHEKRTCLHMAARSGIWELLEVCLQNRLDVNSLTESGWTPVMAACKGGHIDFVKELVKRGADLNLGGGSLSVACTENCLDLIKYLVSQDIDINKRGPKERTPVMAACFHENIEIMEYLQSHGADMTCTDEYKQTCLHIVCKSGNLQLAEKLVRLVPIDDPDGNGLTPLMYAVRSDSPELIDLLITNGANTNTTDSRGNTSLHSACWFLNVNACARLLELGMDVDVLDSVNRTPLMSLARNKKDCTEIANLLVERGANINVKDRGGNTILHVSAKSDGHPGFARYILEKGVDVNTLGAYDHTPVMSACRSGNAGAFDLYLAKGAQLHHTNDHGAKCLHLACMVDTDNTHIVNELLDRRVDINATDGNNKTPAMYAISKGSVTILRLLLARNASFIAPDKRGNQSTLLHYACSIKDINTEKIQLLLQNGLRVNEPNMYYNQTPLMFAARQGNRAAIDVLTQSGADVNKVDRRGRNCADHAESQGHHELAEYLANRSRRIYHRF